MKKEAYFRMMGIDKKADVFSGVGNILGGAYNTAKDAYNVLTKVPGQYWRIYGIDPAKVAYRGVKGAVQNVGKGFEQATQDKVKAMQEKLKAQRVKKAVENRQGNTAKPAATPTPAVTYKQETKTVPTTTTEAKPASSTPTKQQNNKAVVQKKTEVKNPVKTQPPSGDKEPQIDQGMAWLNQYPQMKAALDAAKANMDVKGLGFWQRLWNQIKAWFGSEEGAKALKQDDESKSKWQEAYDKFQAFYGNPQQ